MLNVRKGQLDRLMEVIYKVRNLCYRPCFTAGKFLKLIKYRDVHCTSIAKYYMPDSGYLRKRQHIITLENRVVFNLRIKQMGSKMPL